MRNTIQYLHKELLFQFISKIFGDYFSGLGRFYVFIRILLFQKIKPYL